LFQVLGSGDCSQKNSLLGEFKIVVASNETVVVRICEFYVTGERLPQFDTENPQIHNQSLVDFGAHDDT
jgi:hypothetical protein